MISSGRKHIHHHQDWHTEVDVVEWCKSKIMSKKAEISKQGKNWYICIEGCIITVNASSYTIITAHKEKR
jgi:hypothetical protein